MKSTGIVRKVDELGRIVLPSELRKNLDIKIKDSLEIYVKTLKKGKVIQLIWFRLLREMEIKVTLILTLYAYKGE